MFMCATEILFKRYVITNRPASNHRIVEFPELEGTHSNHRSPTPGK